MRLPLFKEKCSKNDDVDSKTGSIFRKNNLWLKLEVIIVGKQGTFRCRNINVKPSL